MTLLSVLKVTFQKTAICSSGGRRRTSATSHARNKYHIEVRALNARRMFRENIELPNEDAPANASETAFTASPAWWVKGDWMRVLAGESCTEKTKFCTGEDIIYWGDLFLHLREKSLLRQKVSAKTEDFCTGTLDFCTGGKPLHSSNQLLHWQETSVLMQPISALGIEHCTKTIKLCTGRRVLRQSNSALQETSPDSPGSLSLGAFLRGPILQ